MNAGLQDLIILISTYLGWGILAVAAIFSAFIFWKLYSGRDKTAAEARKQAEKLAKEEKKANKASKDKGKRSRDTTPGNAELKQRLQSRAQAPKREEIINRIAAPTVNPPVQSQSMSELRQSEQNNSLKSFLDDDIDEFNFAKQRASRANSQEPQPNKNRNGGPPPPPLRL